MLPDRVAFRYRVLVVAPLEKRDPGRGIEVLPRGRVRHLGTKRTAQEFSQRRKEMTGGSGQVMWK